MPGCPTDSAGAATAAPNPSAIAHAYFGLFTYIEHPHIPSRYE